MNLILHRKIKYIFKIKNKYTQHQTLKHLNKAATSFKN